MVKAIGLYGGTFDPIHTGHLKLALYAKQYAALKQVAFIPCKLPVHKSSPHALPHHRLAMIQLAISQEKAFVLDPQEIERESASYSVITIQSWRHKLGPTTPLCFLMGSDSFHTFTTWYQWKTILQLCHLIVYPRPGSLITADNCPRDLSTRLTSDAHSLLDPAGSIHILHDPPTPISATAIRQHIQQGHPPQAEIPKTVWHYIKQHRLYSR